MNRPMLEGPKEWIMNISTVHREPEWVHLHTPQGKNKKVLLECHCVKCLYAHIRHLVPGPPVSMSHSFPLEELKKNGIIGLYTYHDSGVEITEIIQVEDEKDTKASQ